MLLTCKTILEYILYVLDALGSQWKFKENINNDFNDLLAN